MTAAPATDEEVAWFMGLGHSHVNTIRRQATHPRHAEYQNWRAKLGPGGSDEQSLRRLRELKGLAERLVSASFAGPWPPSALPASLVTAVESLVEQGPHIPHVANLLANTLERTTAAITALGQELTIDGPSSYEIHTQFVHEARPTEMILAISV